jgi:hypothetical protein
MLFCHFRGNLPTSLGKCDQVGTITPNFPVNAELIYVRLKTRWPLHRLQVRYFKPINVGYHSLPVIRFGLVMCLWKLADMLLVGGFEYFFQFRKNGMMIRQLTIYCVYIYYHVYLTLAHMFHFLKEVAPTPIRLVYVIFWPSFRTAFIARTGFLIMLPSVRRLGHCVMSVIGEFVSIAVTWICSMFFFLVG